MGKTGSRASLKQLCFVIWGLRCGIDDPLLTYFVFISACPAWLKLCAGIVEAPPLNTRLAMASESLPEAVPR